MAELATGGGESGPALQSAADEWRAHWLVVIASMLGIAMASMHVYSIGAFIGPIEEEFDWTRANITFGITLVTIVAAIFSPFVGILIDKVGPRRIALPGAVLWFGFFALLSMTSSSVWVWWGLWMMLSVGALACKPTTWTVAVTSLFKQSRGFALAVMLCGTALCSSIVPLLSTRLIDEYGWRTALQVLPALVAVVVLPMLFFFFSSAADKRRISERKGQGASASAVQDEVLAPEGVTRARDALLSGRFLKIAIAAAFFTFAAIGLVVNLVPVLVSNGITRTDAAAAAGLVGLTSIIGRLGTGYLLDKVDSRVVSGLCVLLPIVTCLLLVGFPGSMTAALVAIAVMGLCLGAELDVIAFLVAHHFGTARYGTIFGVISSIWSITSGTGPFVASYVYDVTGSYDVALWAAIPLFLIASASLFSLRAKPETVTAASA